MLAASNDRSSADVRPALAGYLQAVASALAAPDASVERVLEAARAGAIERGGNSAEFHAPDQRFRFAAVYFSGINHEVKSVLFVCDDAGQPVEIAELVGAFGAWRRVTAGSGLSDTYPIIFDVPYPPPTPGAQPRTVETRARVSFTADPGTRGARALEINLFRFQLGR